MTLSTLQAQLRRWAQWLPITRYTLLWVAAIAIGRRILYLPISTADASNTQLPLIRSMALFVAVLLLLFMLLSILSTLASYLYYLWLRRRGRSALDVAFSSQGGKHYLQASLPLAIRPILGFVKAQLRYGQHQYTPSFALLSAKRQKNSLRRAAITGRSQLALPNIQEYQIQAAMLYFQDLFQIISLPTQQPLQASFINTPTAHSTATDSLAPKHTDSMDIRIDQLRKVVGDPLHQKNFESGDDPRRIIWKVFAKNRNLIVRIPEPLEPFASKLAVYASFYQGIPSLPLSQDFLDPMLNYYKTQVWSIYQSLQQQQWQLSYVPDQHLHPNTSLPPHQHTQQLIALAQWHRQQSTAQYFATGSGSLLIISSLCSPQELAQILQHSPASTHIQLVALSACMQRHMAWHWLRSLIWLAPNTRKAQLGNRWLLSPMRRQLRRNEAALASLIAQHR
ncbi:MAG: hypothetical protein IT256_09295 [Chitinophagaceae bacterium]|nr:hypothetical protein [Chitinophagaceae bacterium]